MRLHFYCVFESSHIVTAIVAVATYIRTNCFRNFRRFELLRVNLSHASQNWFELSGVSRNRRFEK